MTDFQKICLDIREDIPISRLEKQLKVGDGTIAKIVKGQTKEPSYSLGKALIDLHQELTGEKHG